VIFIAIEQSVFKVFGSVFEELKSNSNSPSEKLITLMSTSLDMFMEMGDAILIITELWAHAGRGHVHGSDPVQFMEFYEKYRMELESILKEGILANEFREMNTEGVARLLMAFMDGLVWQFVMLNDPLKFETVKTETIESFMKGIVK